MNVSYPEKVDPHERPFTRMANMNPGTRGSFSHFALKACLMRSRASTWEPSIGLSQPGVFPAG